MAGMLFEEIMKFNPYHGKDGRFARSGNYASFTYSPGKSRAHDLAIQREKERMAARMPTAEQAKTLKGIETRTRNLKKEQFRVVDRDGNVVMEKQGDAHSVSFTMGEARENFPGNITIHNHPGGGTFSTVDLSAIGHGATEIRAAAAEGTYILRNIRHGAKYDASREKTWYDMREDLEKASEGFKTDRQLRKEIRKPYDEQLQPYVDKFNKAKADGASRDELMKISVEYTAKLESFRPEIEAATRKAYVDQYHKWYMENAGKYGLEYEFIPVQTRTRKSDMDEMIGTIEKGQGDIVLDADMQRDVEEISGAIMEELRGEFPDVRKSNDVTILKADEDKRLVFGWASIALTIEGEQLEDRQGDMIDPEDLEETVYEYVLNFRDTGEEHIPTMRKKGKLVESCVLTEEKQRAMGIPPGVVPVGWWIGFKIEDDDAWERVKNGTYRMFSIEGVANREPVEKAVDEDKGTLFIGLNVTGADDLAMDGGESPEDFHVTLLYGHFNTKGHDASAVDSIVNSAVNAIKADVPDTIEFDRIGTFSPSESSDGKKVIYAGVKAGQLESVHERLLAELKKRGLTVEKTFPEYRPHMTLAYVDPEEDEEEKEITATGAIRKITIGLEGSEAEMNDTRTVAKTFLEMLGLSTAIGNDQPERFDEIEEVVGKSDRFDHIEEVQKFNPYHGKDGRFASANGATSFTYSPGKSKAHDNAIARAKVRDGDIQAVAGGIQKVRDSVSNTANPIKRKSADIDDIMKEGGCDRKTAEQAAAKAKEVFDRAAAVEPKITGDIVSAVSANSGKMYGLDFRMKQETSLGRKIAKDAKSDFGGDLDAAAAEIKDAVRYTAVFEAKDFTAGYKNVKSALESKGYTEERCKNFYESYRDGKSQQKAVQCVFSDKDGNRMELQFHTYESQGAKEVNHPLYEKHRAASTKAAERKDLDGRMKNISSTVPDPEGVYSIKAHK